MLTLHHTITPDDVVVDDGGKPAFRIRQQPDGTCLMTDLQERHTAPVASPTAGRAKAERILRLRHAGDRR
jgi:hypothetical protein